MLQQRLGSSVSEVDLDILGVNGVYQQLAEPAKVRAAFLTQLCQECLEEVAGKGLAIGGAAGRINLGVRSAQIRGQLPVMNLLYQVGGVHGRTELGNVNRSGNLLDGIGDHPGGDGDDPLER